jgi:hypothetical protein
MPKLTNSKNIIYAFLENYIEDLETMEKGHIEKLYALCFPGEYVMSVKTFTAYVQKFKKEKGIKKKYKENKYYLNPYLAKSLLIVNMLKDIANSD